jgi:hypothetical protein
MHFIERAFWVCVTRDGDAESDAPKNRNQPFGLFIQAFDQSRDELLEKRKAMRRNCYVEALPPEGVFAFNDTYLEIRAGGFECFRGIATLTAMIVIALMLFFAHLFITELSDGVLNLADLLDIIVDIAMIGLLQYFFFDTLWHYLRLETFRPRYLLIRFNRGTQEVFLHRHEDCGHPVVLPFAAMTRVVHENYPQMFVWSSLPDEIQFPPAIAMIGSVFDTTAVKNTQWEFIRRYMLSGAKAVPLPKIISMGANPLYSVYSAYRLFRYFRFKATILNILWKVSGILLIPLLALAHWVSLITCFVPRWDTAIEIAGTNKIVPNITVIANYPDRFARGLMNSRKFWRARERGQHNQITTIETRRDRSY